MSQPDLIIFPQDWTLAIWWLDWPTVQAHPAGQWFAWVKRVGSETAMVPAWEFWTARRHGLGMPWHMQMVEWEKPSDVLMARGHLFQENERWGKVFHRGGMLEVRGFGGELIRRVEAGERLPRWLHLLVIERRPAMEGSAA